MKGAESPKMNLKVLIRPLVLFIKVVHVSRVVISYSIIEQTVKL